MSVKKVDPDVPDAVDNRYYVRVYNPNGGGQYKKVVRGHRAADAHEVEMRARMSGGSVATASERKVTVRQLLDQIVAAKQRTWAPNTKTSYAHALDAHIYPTIGDLRVARLVNTFLVLTELFDQVEHTSGRGQRIRVEMLVRRLLTVAMRQGIIDRNPLDGIAWAKPTATRGQVYAPEWADILRVRDDVADETAKVRSGAAEMALAELDVLAGSGVRVGELMGLADDDVDMEAQTITVRRQALYVRGAGYLFGPPKTDDSGPRVIPVPKAVLASIATTKLRNGTRSVTLPWEQPDGKPHTARLLFFSLAQSGLPASATSLSQRLHRIGVRLELPGSLHAHCYRHRYTTTLHDAGVPQRIIDYVTGHLSQGSMSMLYTQVTKDGLARARQTTEDAWVEAIRQQQSAGQAKPALLRPS